MNNQFSIPVAEVAVYLTAQYKCSYLPADAQSLFVDSKSIINQETYQYLLSIGFRRSGNQVYRPHCAHCNACVSIRIPVAQFEPRRSQRRCWQRNLEHLQVIPKTSDFNAEHYALYNKYTTSRHARGGMESVDSATYLEFLTTSWCPTMFVELRHSQNLIGVAVTDVLPNALSACYTFFDPDSSQYSPGVLAILWQIQEAKRLGLEYLYLGYWIRNCRKMSYKDQYRPLEAWYGRQWQYYDKTDVLCCHG